jgi:hypothetical protein
MAWAAQMLDEQVVACANIQGLMRLPLILRSERADAEEAGLLFKTETAMLEPATTQRLRSPTC